MFKKILLATSMAFTTAYATELPESLFKHIKKDRVQNVKSTPLKDFYQMQTRSGEYIYIHKDGRFAYTTMFDLEKNISITKQEQQKDKLVLLNNLKEKDMIIYPAKGKERGSLTIFTDTSCPYCTKLHREVPKLQEKGVRVKYAAFPRGGKSGPGYKKMVSVWCAKDRKKALDMTFSDQYLKETKCSDVITVNNQYALGNKLGIQGTPASFSDKGVKIDGYAPAAKILLKMGL